MYKSFIIKFIIFQLCNLSSQDIPNDYFLFHHENLLLDLGENWKFNSTLSGPRYKIRKDDFNYKDSLFISSTVSLNASQSDMILNGYFSARTQSNLYSYFSPKIVSDPDIEPGFSGIKQENSRFGFRAGELIYSGLGFENEWVMLQYGRGKENWSAGNDIQISLSNNSTSYDYGVAEFRYKSYRTRYFHGWLERVDSTNRFITGKAVEWNSNNNFIFSLSEIIIYSGVDRQIDLSYLNPLSSHLEIELNKRQNQISSNGHANAIWQFAIDAYTKYGLRISMNLVIDEFILDKVEIDNGKNNALAHSLRLAWSPKNKNIPMLFYFQSINNGTNTFKHENGFNNFVQRGFPLGSTLGNDAWEAKLGITHYKFENYIFNIEYGYKQVGGKSLYNGMYTPNSNYEKEKFPSGDIINNSSINLKLIKFISKLSTLNIEVDWDITKKSKGSFIFKTGLYFGMDYNSF